MNDTPIFEHPSPGRTAFILVIWPEQQTGDVPIWRGALESGRGVRNYFRSLQELNCLLSELGGWVDDLDRPQTSHPGPHEIKEK
jgi:hypothetical protein